MFTPYVCDIIGTELQTTNGNQVLIKKIKAKDVPLHFWGTGSMVDAVTGQQTTSINYKAMMYPDSKVEEWSVLNIENEWLFLVESKIYKHLSSWVHHILLSLSKTNG